MLVFAWNGRAGENWLNERVRVAELPLYFSIYDRIVWGCYFSSIFCVFCGCFEYINTHESARTCEGRSFIRRWDFGWLFTYLGISAKKMLFQDKVQSLMTCGLVVQMTCMSIIASAMFFKQHKKQKWCADDPGAFFLAGMNGLLYLGAFCCRDYVMNPS